MGHSRLPWHAEPDWRCIRSQAKWPAVVVLVIVVVAYGIFALAAGPTTPVRLVVYAFSTQEGVLTQGIFPAFERDWEATTGRDLQIDGVFGASGTLVGQINLGAPADVAILSNAQQMNWLRLGRKVRRDAQALIVGCTPMVIAVRPGLPFAIQDYADLSQAGLVLLHTNPHSSGAGQWAVLAEYGSALWNPAGGNVPSADSDPSLAVAQLKAIWRNVHVMAASARAAMALFELGAGDALVTYEQDALLARERGVALEIVYPPRTIIAQHAAVIVDDHVTRPERAATAAFVEFILSDAGQQIFSSYYLRPPDCRSQPASEGAAGRSPALVQPLTIEDLGGWAEAYAEVVEALWQAEIEPRLDLEPSFRLLGTGGE